MPWVCGLLCHGLLVGTAGPAWALPEEPAPGGEPTGELEELPEMIPDNPVPWHDSLLELPLWMQQEEEEISAQIRPANHGAGLFPPEVWPIQPEPVPGPLIWDLFPDSSPGMAGLRAPENITPEPLGPEEQALLAGPRPAGVFADPGRWIRGRSQAQMESLVQRWLNEQCIFKTTVLILGPGMELPADFDPEALRQRWFAGQDQALLVLYFYGQPERTQAVFSPAVRAAYGAALVKSVVDAAVKEAGRVTGGPEQFERICYKMSVRLHWLSRTRMPEADQLAENQTAAASQAWQRSGLKVLGWVLATASGLAALLFWKRGRSLRAGEGEPVLLPEWEFEPRFGAPHCGGFSAVINFSRPAPPG